MNRPRTTDKSRKSNRRPILTEAEMGLQRPQMAHTALESDQAEPKSRMEEKGLKKENYVEDEVVRPVTTPTTQRKPADAALAVRAAQQQVKNAGQSQYRQVKLVRRRKQSNQGGIVILQRWSGQRRQNT